MILYCVNKILLYYNVIRGTNEANLDIAKTFLYENKKNINENMNK